MHSQESTGKQVAGALIAGAAGAAGAGGFLIGEHLTEQRHRREKAEIADLKIKCEEYVSQIRQLNENCSTLTEQCEMHTSTISTAQVAPALTATKAKEETERMKQELATVQSRLNDTQSKLKTLHKTQDNLNIEERRLQDELQKKMAEIADLKIKCEEYVTQNEKCKIALALTATKAKKKTESMKQELAAVQSRLNDTQSELKTLHKTQDNLNIEERGLQENKPQEIKALRDEIVALKAALGQLRARLLKRQGGLDGGVGQ